jgi:hypothetical protein
MRLSQYDFSPGASLQYSALPDDIKKLIGSLYPSLPEMVRQGEAIRISETVTGVPIYRCIDSQSSIEVRFTIKPIKQRAVIVDIFWPPSN